jgi:hypothetical protein
MKYPRFLKLIVLLSLAVIIFDSCKKGADDPLISFRSRNDRICAKWVLKSAEGKYTNSSATALYKEKNYSYSGSNFTLTYLNSSGSQTVMTYDAYELQMELDKKYTVSYTENYNLNGNFNSISYTGYWYWMDDKKKTMLFIPLNETMAIDCNQWEVTELKHKQITLKFSLSETQQGVTETNDWSLVFTNID